MIRLFDVILSLIGLLFCAPILTVLWFLLLFETRSPLFIQQRVGRNQKPFYLIKFRTMRAETASVATHLADISAITKFGHFLRNSKLDELPQLVNVLKGDMSLVGPRPCLFNQHELIAERAARNIFSLYPGVTGLAQINHVDMSRPKLVAKLDAKMLQDLSVKTYLRYIVITMCSINCSRNIKSRL